MAKKPSKKRPTPEQLAAADQQWTNLESELEREMQILGPSRIECGRILYAMKLWLRRWGLNKGRRGRWQSVCDRYFDGQRKTAENYIRAYQQYAEIPLEDCVVQPTRTEARNSQQDCENNPVKVTGFERPSIQAANDEDCDRSLPEGRVGIECVFVLTKKEKHAFMEAVKALGPLQATQEMFKAVVAAAPKTSGAAS